MSRRTLSIQSHVVYGYVGNKAAVFPLQLLGLEVDVINSVQFSNHTGYPNKWEGTVMNGDQLLSILEGMERNQLLDEIQYVLTGYIGSASFLNAIRSLVLKIKSDKPQFRYICDPVLGDDGRLYVPKELVKLFRTQIIPIADICTPNQYEVEQLTGINIGTLQDAKRACAHFHNMGPSIVFLTSLEIPVDQKYNNAGWEGEWITVFASQRKMLDKMSQDEYYRIDCPKIPGSFTGTGDLTTALILAHLDKTPDNLALVMEKVVNTMQVVIRRTSDAMKKEPQSTSPRSKELQLIQSKKDIENPPSTFRVVRVE